MSQDGPRLDDWGQPLSSRRCVYHEQTTTFSPLPWPHLPLHSLHLLPSHRGRSFSFLSPGSIHFISSTLSSPFEHLPLLLFLSFWLKPRAHLSYSEKPFFTLCCCLRMLLSTFFPYQSPRIRPLQHLKHCGACESCSEQCSNTFQFSEGPRIYIPSFLKGGIGGLNPGPCALTLPLSHTLPTPRICISNEHRGDAMLEGSPVSVIVHSSLTSWCPFLPPHWNDS